MHFSRQCTTVIGRLLDDQTDVVQETRLLLVDQRKRQQQRDVLQIASLEAKVVCGQTIQQSQIQSCG